MLPLLVLVPLPPPPPLSLPLLLPPNMEPQENRGLVVDGGVAAFCNGGCGGVIEGPRCLSASSSGNEWRVTRRGRRNHFLLDFGVSNGAAADDDEYRRPVQLGVAAIGCTRSTV